MKTCHEKHSRILAFVYLLCRSVCSGAKIFALFPRYPLYRWDGILHPFRAAKSIGRFCILMLSEELHGAGGFSTFEQPYLNIHL